MTKVKLSDVAQAAGVSKSTVSQYLNGRYNYMSTDTRGRIEQAINKLNYVPNSIARSLKTDKTRTIGVIVRDIAGFYTSQALRGMDDYCKDNGFHLIIYNTDFDAAVEEKALRALQALRVDGIIMASSGQYAALLDSKSMRDMPVVQFQLEHNDNAKNVVVSDYREAAFEATDYLIQLGHRRIAFLTQQFNQVKSRNERYRGYVQALEKHGIEQDKNLVQFWSRESGFARPVTEMLAHQHPPTALFAQHLAITTDLLRDLEGAGLQIPDDISVLGFDDLPLAEFFKVPITVVKQQPYKVGEEAARLLINRLEKGGKRPIRKMIPCSLEVRQSCRSI